MPNLTRRALLKQSPAVFAIAAASTETAAKSSTAAATIENSELLTAYERFLAARAEVGAAEDALEWLADEWRHLWPLAPEEILGGANADQYAENAERDIAGRIIVRDTAALTSRMAQRDRQGMPKTCFHVDSPERIRSRIEVWQQPRVTRTEKGLARARAEQAKLLSEYRHKLQLSEEYHAETARLRALSGVELIKDRVSSAKSEFRSACLAISKAEAVTAKGLRIKAEALKSDELVRAVLGQGGILGDLARFIDATLAVIGGAS